MHSLVKGIILSVWIWFIIKVSEKVSGNTKHQIQNEFLYYFIYTDGIFCPCGLEEFPDRKSTRLNSSHPK